MENEIIKECPCCKKLFTEKTLPQMDERGFTPCPNCGDNVFEETDKEPYDFKREFLKSAYINLVHKT